jgi:hypothetical protein
LKTITRVLIDYIELCSQASVTAEEMEKDMVVIATQLAYAMQLAGNKCAAMESYQSILLSG